MRAHRVSAARPRVRREKETEVMTASEPRRHPFFGVPPPRQPRPAAEEPALRGKRVILSTPEGFVYDMRAVSEVYLNESGREVIDIVTEEAYYRWMFVRATPKRVAYGVDLVWAE